VQQARDPLRGKADAGPGDFGRPEAVSQVRAEHPEVPSRAPDDPAERCSKLPALLPFHRLRLRIRRRAGHLGGKRGYLQAPPPVIERHPQRDLRQEGVEGPGALEPEPRQRALLDQLRPELLPQVGRVLSGRSPRGAREDPQEPAIELAEQLRPGPPLAARATLDELAVTHTAIPRLREPEAASAR
jgi:hypothetical protein